MSTRQSATRVKICCIANRREAQMAVGFGASAIGLVGKMPSGPGPISDAKIKDIANWVPPPVASFLLTSETTAKDIIAHHRKVYTSAIQIVDQLQDARYEEIRSALPGIKLIQVIHVLDEKSIDEAIKQAEHVDALLLDSGKPNLQVKELGGTGRTHDWRISRKICQEVSVPVFLAGGLNAENVARAIEEVQPFGVDLCSGVRTKGQLDPYKLEAFVNQVFS